jgi:hypothetical protein
MFLIEEAEWREDQLPLDVLPLCVVNFQLTLNLKGRSPGKRSSRHASPFISNPQKLSNGGKTFHD